MDWSIIESISALNLDKKLVLHQPKETVYTLIDVILLIMLLHIGHASCIFSDMTSDEEADEDLH